jgi:hypothetical protein
MFKSSIPPLMTELKSSEGIYKAGHFASCIRMVEANYMCSGIVTPCLLPLPLPIRTSPSLNLHWHTTIELTARVVLTANIPLADLLFSQATQARQTDER